jgi:hypothetical protein
MLECYANPAKIERIPFGTNAGASTAFAGENAGVKLGESAFSLFLITLRISMALNSAVR